MEGVWRILSSKMNEIIHSIQSMLTGKTLKNFRQISYFLEIWLVGKLWVHTCWSLLWIVTWLVVVRCISYNGDVPRLEGTTFIVLKTTRLTLKLHRSEKSTYVVQALTGQSTFSSSHFAIPVKKKKFLHSHTLCIITTMHALRLEKCSHTQNSITNYQCFPPRMCHWHKQVDGVPGQSPS